MISFDMTINLGTVVQTVIVVGGGLVALGAMRNSVQNLQTEFTKSEQDSSKKFDDIHVELKKIADVITKQAVQDTRILHLEEDMRDLRKGDGWIKSPLVPRGGVDGEYP